MTRKTVVIAIGKDLGSLRSSVRAAGHEFVHREGKIVDTESVFPFQVRLEGEEFLVVETQERDVRSVSEMLRRSGQAVVFQLPPQPNIEPPSGKISGVTLPARLRHLERGISETHHQLRDASDRGHIISPAAQWLIDNAHALRAHLSDVHDGLSAELTAHVEAGSDGLPRIAATARKLISESDGVILESAIIHALENAQGTRPLQVDELWLMPVLIRLSLVEYVTEQGVDVRYAQQLREMALFWANRLAAAHRQPGAESDRILKLLLSSPAGNSPVFLSAVAEQLHDQDRALVRFQSAVEAAQARPLDEIVRQEQHLEALQGVRISNAFSSLRALSRIDFLSVFESTSRVEQILMCDPAGIYPKSDNDTRSRARRAIQEIARHSGGTEWDVAKAAVEHVQAGNGAHVLEFLIHDKRTQLERDFNVRISLGQRFERALRNNATTAYVTSILLTTLALSVVALSFTIELDPRQRWMLVPLAALALFPLSELAMQVVNVLVITFFRANPLPKMDFKQGIPADHTALVAVPMMLTSRKTIQQELDKLEIRYLANPEANVYFSLVSDFADAGTQESPGDAPLLDALVTGIDSLNAKYSGRRFLAFHRGREWSESEQSWIGRERKRGKIEALNSFLLGRGDPSLLVAGSQPARPVRYVITLDADTQLPPYSARRLVETIAHPLNKVELDPETKVWRRGFAVIQPRVSISLPGATVTRFTRITGDPHGTDPYCRLVSDSQQDLFGHAIFHGKAIYEVASFDECLHHRFPNETILSHDLIEGAHCGVGLATDIELFENMPVDYASFSRRQHRWIRGDWQIAPWMLPKVPAATGPEWVPNPLNAVNRWRIFDNLRRSLVAPASVALLMAGWFLSATPGFWTLVLVLAAAIPALAMLLDRVALRLQGSVLGGRGSYDELARALFSIIFLPHQAWLSIDAIVRACFRMTVSHRAMLEWQTAESAGHAASSHYSSTLRQLTVVSAVAALAAVFQAWLQRGSAMPLLVLWASGPFILRWLSTPVRPKLSDDLDSADRARLRRLARRTWRFFDDLVGTQTNWLPPDNTQLALRIEVAGRTSPTNIGLWLNSAQAAHDFGFLTGDEMCARLTRTMGSIERMEKHEGHLFNWYRTDDLAPLPPRYISSVDSGNLLASYWVLQQGCREITESEPLTARQVWGGLAGTFDALREAVGREASAAFELRAIRRMLRTEPDFEDLPSKLRMVATLADRAKASLGTTDAEARYWAERFSHEAVAWVAAVERYYPWLEVLILHPDSTLRRLGGEAPALRRAALDWRPSLSLLASNESPVAALVELRHKPGIEPALVTWLNDLQAELARAQRHARSAASMWQALCERTSRLAQAVNMAVVFDGKRKLFGIGHAVGGPTEFNSHYDLLASECRIASLVSIAKGDVPIEHWQHLGRARTPSPSGQTLLSWSGTMFEYLMPLLFVRTYPNSLLEHACSDAVERQIEHGGREGMPWGVSESAYSAIDSAGTYQYHAFGIPDLSLRRISEAERVVAPYATVLALQVSPREAIDNLERLEKIGLSGPMGFYEAIDFTQRPAPSSDEGVIIYCYMAHHQGMSLVAIDNVLNDGAMQRRFHEDFRIRAIESLLFERIPNSPLVQRDEEPELAPATAKTGLVGAAPPERMWTEATAVPRTQFLGNGRMASVVTNSGSGYCRWKGIDLSRWRSDSANDQWGVHMVLRDVKTGALWSAAYQPVGGTAGFYEASFTADRATFQRKAYDIESTLDVAVSPEDDVEIRRLRLTNWSSRARAIDLTTFMELALAPHGADRAHPAFSKMFVETECPERGLLIASRRKRAEHDPEIWVAQMLVGPIGAVSFETDRERFLGRGNSLDVADGFGRSLDNSEGSVVDPVFSLRCRLHLPAAEREEISLVTVAAESRETLLGLVDKYRRSHAVSQAFELVWNRTQLDLRYLRIGPGDVHRFQQLGGALLYPDPNLRGPADRIARDRLGQSSLWASGISGDLPMVTATLSDQRGMSLLRELLLAHKYLGMRGMRFDLVVLNQEPASYDRPLAQRIRNQVEALAPGGASMDQPGGVYVRDWHTLTEPLANQLISAAYVFLSGGRGGLEYQLASASDSPVAVPSSPSASRPAEPSAQLPFLELPYFNGVGGFTQDGREYAIYLAPGVTTPQPWANVIAHETFGTMVTESGLGFTWRGNSQANRLTPWHNDPVSDPQSEAIYLRDEDSGAFWSPTALPIRGREAYRARHGHGYTVFEHNSHGIAQELTVFVPIDGDGAGLNVKVCRLKLRNDSARSRSLSVTYFAELVLGSQREEQQLRIATSHDAASGAVLATQWWAGPGAGEVAFVASAPKSASHTGDRLQFLGRNRGIARPAALEKASLDNRTGPGLDPAAAVHLSVNLEPGAETEAVFMLGQCPSVEDCRALIERFQDRGRVEDSLRTTREWWDATLGRLTVRTPVLSLDLLLNRWLLYQSLSCRFWGRSALYQSGGAIGFRDQLQDSLALLYADPSLTRRHILVAASRQFEEGDVQHWWHPETGLGVRTRCSDDLLWLPFVVAHYVRFTGDTSILAQSVGFLTAPELAPHEHEKMFGPGIADRPGTLLDHCFRAIERARGTGPHGLPLMGNGDWNDGMNMVGIEGRGESVWLAWFFCAVLGDFASLLETMGDHASAQRLRADSSRLAEAVERHCWDGDWYLRAFFDNGQPLGSAATAKLASIRCPKAGASLAVRPTPSAPAARWTAPASC